MRFGLILSLLACLSAGHLSAARADETDLDSPMYQDPALPAARVVTVAVGARDLWLRALARPEAEMKCRATQAIVLAHGRGVKGLAATVPPLRAELDRPGQHPTVRLVVAQALITLDARDTAPSLLREAQAGDSDLRNLVEPALARWDYRPARAVWLARLRAPEASQRDLILAVQALAAVGEKQAADSLLELVLSGRAAGPVRLEAAAALGGLRTSGLEKDAERLAGDRSPRGLAGRLAAAALLRRHQGDAATRLLKRLMGDPEPAVAARAVARLIELDPKLVVPAVGSLLASPDAVLRSQAVEVLRREPTAGGIRSLAGHLADPDPEVRAKARRSLRELAGRKEFRGPVIAEAARVLAGKDWRGLEQAAILLARLDYKPAAGRLLGLLKHDRPEVLLTAAWGLRQLAVKDTLPAVTRYVAAKQQELRDNAGHPDAMTVLYDRQVAQLNQLLGQQKYGQAEAALRAFIPRMDQPMKPPVGQESRAAAVWALGLLHEGKVAADLVAPLEARLNDAAGSSPEGLPVRRMSAVALGRMRAKQALASLRKFCPEQKPGVDAVHNACGWAIEQITGQAMQPPGTIREVQEERFFLAPVQ
jgi:HEAT repeat protein